MLKLGAYGFLRFSLPITPDASQYLAPVVIVLSLIAVIYIGLVALVQKDMKKLVAYSSIAHMGFVTLGFFMFWGVTAAASAGVYFARGDINPYIAAPVAAGVMIGATLGSMLLGKLQNRSVRAVFVIVLIVVSVQMLIKGLRGSA